MTKSANETQQLIITTNFKAKVSKVENSQELKRKLKIDSIGNIKKQKLQLQECINSLKEGFESETLAADENQDLSCVNKAAAFLRSMKEKQKLLVSLGESLKNLEDDYKATRNKQITWNSFRLDLHKLGKIQDWKRSFKVFPAKVCLSNLSGRTN